MNLTIASTAIRQDDAGRYCLNDLHRAAVAAGSNARTKEPGKFMSNAQTAELIEELETTQNPGSFPVLTIEGRSGGTFACKELVYAYAMWISPRFHIEVIRAYDAMVSVQARRRTHGALVVRAFSELGTFTARHMHLGARKAYRMGLRAMAEKYGQDIVDSVDFDFEALPDLPAPPQKPQALPRASARTRDERLMERLERALRNAKRLSIPTNAPNRVEIASLLAAGLIPRQVLVKTMKCSAAELDALVATAKEAGLLAERSGFELGYAGTLYTLAGGAA